ncbi:MAG: MotA/TolQ/ExbB proton channel family protein [Myxococcota bacterium]|jgi:hypothetical protein|nr:MotA/TolQ/ExbB proton channel family protein [Myxococcota bacterium]
MLLDALFDTYSIVVLVVICVFSTFSLIWYYAGRRQHDVLIGRLEMLRGLGMELPLQHPIRKRLESAPVVDLSFEEIGKIMHRSARVRNATRALIRLNDRVAWMERFSHYATHLGILGTVFALVMSDPTDLVAFRKGLPIALGTTFWGLVGALILATIAGQASSVLESARQVVRDALLLSLDEPSPKAAKASKDAKDANPLILPSPAAASTPTVDQAESEEERGQAPNRQEARAAHQDEGERTLPGIDSERGA